jgi:hypothetical protein
MAGLGIALRGFGKALKKTRDKGIKKMDKFATKAIAESHTPGKRLKGWAKIAAPAIASIPFTIRSELKKQKEKEK